MILVDTDVLVWNFRGNEKAALALEECPGFYLSAVTYMELLQGLRNKRELRALRQSMHQWDAELFQITEDISSRAVYLVEEFGLSHAMAMADGLIAATALHLGATLLTANDRHYRHVDGLEVRVFRP